MKKQKRIGFFFRKLSFQKEKIIHINNNQQKKLKFDTERRGHFSKNMHLLYRETERRTTNEQKKFHLKPYVQHLYRGTKLRYIVQQRYYKC